MKRKTYLTPAQQLDKTLGYYLNCIDLRWDSSQVDHAMMGMALRPHKWLRQGDFVVFNFSNGQGERWVCWAISSKGRRINRAYLHFGSSYPGCRKLSRRGRYREFKYGQGYVRRDVAIVKDRLGQPLKFRAVLDQWTAGPTDQQAIVDSLRAGTVAGR